MKKDVTELTSGPCMCKALADIESFGSFPSAITDLASVWRLTRQEVAEFLQNLHEAGVVVFTPEGRNTRGPVVRVVHMVGHLDRVRPMKRRRSA